MDSARPQEDTPTRPRIGLSVAPMETRREASIALVPPDAEELLEQLIVYGTPPEARRRLARWHEAGAAFPVLLLRPNLTPDERALTLDAFRPMLRM
jgi:alkanesulfonate monooxygenase SsuD/methylene tetrahydromethanopterin reductase-like flavin-dependent oxidoreductase (luciferase family)